LGKTWRALRRRILTPNDSAALLDVRGFHKKNPAAQEILETIGKTFLKGYAFAAEARTVADAERNLETIPTRFRGFAYEGAAMGFAMRDGMPFGGSGHLAAFLGGRAGVHDYMAYIGLGWAMARLPRFRWPKSSAIDPFMRWLVLDGYGFHQAYFRTRQYVEEQYQDPRFSWPAEGPQWYAQRAIDQGIGRALWFVGGTDPGVVADLVAKFDERRKADLFSGIGLAATYAGGGDTAELHALLDIAADYRPQLAQGSGFGAEARVRAGLLMPHTEQATKLLCGLPAQQAAQITHDTRPPSAAAEAGVPAYEVWRQRTASEFSSLRRS
jgi:enediyne biosynthesis protein E3